MYTPVEDAVIIGVLYNSEKNPYRLKAFYNWYKSIKGLNYRILEITIGDDHSRQLPIDDPNIEHIHSNSKLWHKEGAQNYLIKKLPKHFKYVILSDLDVLCTDKDWLVKTCKLLETNYTMVQPYEYVIHLDEHEDKPGNHIAEQKENVQVKGLVNRRIWRSFASNWGKRPKDYIFELEGHCGFMYAFRREVLDNCSLLDISFSFDHIATHCAVGDYPCNCINKAFKDDLERIYSWADSWYKQTQGKLGYVEGNEVWHMYHAPLGNRQYLQRAQEYTKIYKTIKDRDENGLLIRENDEYMNEYFKKKEVSMKDSWYNWFMYYYYLFLIKLEFSNE